MSRWLDWTEANRAIYLGTIAPGEDFPEPEVSRVALPGVREAAIDLVLDCEAGFVQHGGFLHRIRGMDLAAEANDWSRLLTHLLKNTDGPQWAVGRYLKDIVPSLRQGDPSPDMTELINQAMRLGASDAADW